MEAPPEGVLKINVDASFSQDSASFSVGMMRNHRGEFLLGKNLSREKPDSAFEAEALGVREALSWIKEQRLQNHNILLESDSLLVVSGVNSLEMNLLEVGEVLEHCKILLRELTATSLHFVRNQANQVAHKYVKLSCLVNCHNLFTSLPSRLLETVFIVLYFNENFLFLKKII